jgi:Zn-dependent membrane protease YugP
MFFDWNYFLWVAIPAMVLSGLTQLYLTSTYRKWGNVRNSTSSTGAEVARILFERTALEAIPLQRAPGALSDHYDPQANIVRLSETVSDVPSVAAMAVAAHELGHVQQHQAGSPLIAMRSALIPAVRFSPTISYLCIMAGLFMNMAGLIWLGILFFGAMVVFSLLTLPVEFDASRRGMRLLEEAGLLSSAEDRQGARQMLTAAGLTYVAAAITSVLQLLYYISLAQRSSRRA